MDISKMIELARTSAVSFLYCVRAARQRDPAKPSHFVSTCIAMEGYIERAIDRLKSVNPEVSGIDDQIRIFLGALDRLVGGHRAIRSKKALKTTKEYKRLNALNKMGKDIPKVITDHISDYMLSIKERKVKDRQKLRDFLKHFPLSDAQKSPVENLDAEKTDLVRMKPPLHCHEEIEALYKVLSQHCVCEENPFSASLRLYEIMSAATREADEKAFELLMLRHPHDNSGTTASYWLESVIRFSRQSPGKLCKMMESVGVAQSKLSVEDGVLWYRGFQSSKLPPYLLRSPSLSLRQLLEKLDRREVTGHHKLTLQVQIVKAFWQFYASSWMQRTWNKDLVHFLFQRRGQSSQEIKVDDPFLEIRFDMAAPGQQRVEQYPYFTWPPIHSLGVILLEIELVDCIDRAVQDYGFLSESTGRPKQNAELFAAEYAVKCDHILDNDETYPEVASIIKSCLDATSDLNRLHNRSVSEQRDAIFKLIVSPLETLLKNGFMDLKQNVGGLLHGTVNVGLQAVQSSTLHSPVNANQSQTRDPNPASHGWFSRLDELTAVLTMSGDRDAHSRPTRVAILDTGMSKKYQQDAALRNSIKEYRDFVNGSTSEYQDLTGHGTNICDLLLKVYPAAHIYIGRIWGNRWRHSTEQVPDRMAKAIDHCREEWQVDIVVIPSGFNSDYERVTEALNKARSANIIVFAAAGNHGNVDGVAFPARLYSASMLLCMFATDARANASVRWNPRVEARQGAKGCYAILGENICLQTDANLNSCQGCKTALSGTSYSAAIGAGLAGHLLDFSRQPDCRERIRRRNSLAKVEGMVSVFWSMCEGSDRQVPCMTPWKLLPKLGENDPKPDMWTWKEQARNSICETMSRALEKTY
ncbi:hypothetical protein MCOR27_005926 [Pyricularia oryzae]|nr:hypothetical protein MCOR19_001414 [Pyricularia oryzae]KAI6277808.1 hypothetical protein MCOR27_005926 [Pyricularia oryzae]KAI6300679.1 hypothetical protein MCOR29_010926 [Pyricularia oryzae]KAI6635621.1 hypothetical protein MCOR08_003985 [Pyricularia oryzae]